MNQSSGDTQREAAALADTLVNQGDNGSQQATDSIPVHVVQSIREELKSLKTENETLKNHFNMMQWNSQNKPQEPQNPFKDIDPEESIKVKDALNLYQNLERKFEGQLAEIKLGQKSPDYGDVVRKYLPLAAQEDPELLHEIKNSPNPYTTAYRAAKASKAYQEDLIREKIGKQESAPKKHQDADRVVNNLKQSGSLASVASNVNPAGSPVSFKSMSDDEFLRWKSDNLGKARARTE